VIERNTTIPTSHTMTFTTTDDGQTSVEVHVLQGERELASANKSLAKFHLPGIPAAPRGVPKIEVTFDIDADGIVHCSARDYGSGTMTSIIIQRSTGLSIDEVEQLQKEAVEFAEQDKQERETISARVHAEALCADAERTIKKWGERIEKSYVDKVSRAVEGVKEALEKDQTEEIKATKAGLEVALLDLGRVIHTGNRTTAASSKSRIPPAAGPIELGEPPTD
jgi:molecular chaperone DnaK